MFGIETLDHTVDENTKALQPKIEKLFFVGYSKDVKGCRLIQPNSTEIIIRRDVNFNEDILACDPNLVFVPSFPYKSSLMHVSSSYISPFL